MVVSVPQTKAGVIVIVRVAQAAGENSSRQPTAGFLTSNGPCGRALFRPAPTGPRAAENWTRSPPPHHRGCLCLGYGVCVDCTPLNNPNLRRTWP